MSNDGSISRLWKLEAKINMLVLDGKREPEQVAAVLQAILEEPVTPAIPKFTLVTEFPIVVPDDYDHATCLAKFHTEHRPDFYYWNDDATDAHFPNPSRVLKPGDRFLVKVFAQTVSGFTTSVKRLDFIKSQGGILVGAQGLPLVWQQQRVKLPRGYWYSSFDEKDRLWKDAERYHRVPSLDAYSDGGWGLHLGCFGSDWNDVNRLLCFCDLPESSAA